MRAQADMARRRYFGLEFPHRSARSAASIAVAVRRGAAITYERYDTKTLKRTCGATP